jgi:hypothetical protein
MHWQLEWWESCGIIINHIGKMISKVDQIPLIWACILFHLEGARGPGQRQLKHCNSPCMILCQGFQDKLDKECLHLVVVLSAEGDCQVFNIWQSPSACKSFGVGDILMPYWGLVEKWHFFSFFFLAVLVFLEKKWNEGQRRVVVSMSEVACKDGEHTAIIAGKICVVKIQIRNNLRYCVPGIVY